MMRRMLAAALMLGAALLSACSAAGQVEGQAFVVSLAIDRAADGRTVVSAQFPSYGAQKTQSEKGKSDYLVSSGTGDTFEEALYTLGAVVPRALNLTQIKSLLVSEALASSPAFADILRTIKLACRINGDAVLVVVRGEAGAFLAAQKPLIGLRLSDTLVTETDRYERLGTIPRCTLSGAFYAIHSFYGDPVAPLAALAGSGAAAEEPQDAAAGSLPRTGENRDEYFGAALFRGGEMVGRLTGGEMQLLWLILSGRARMTMELAGAMLEVGRIGGLQVRIDLSGEAPRIDVTFEVGVENMHENVDEEGVLREMTDGLGRLTSLCQSLAVDPFGYGRRAAAQFPTVGDWLEYDWRARFARAAVNYHLTLRRINV